MKSYIKSWFCLLTEQLFSTSLVYYTQLMIFSIVSDINRIYGVWNATDLWYAANRGEYQKCQSLVARDADVNIPDDCHVTPLCAAARWGSLDICKLLLEHGADPNIASISGHTPLAAAAEFKHHKVCQYLMLHADIDYGKIEKYFGNILCHLSHHGDLAACQKLVQNLPEAEINMKNSYGNTALNKAAEQEYFEVFDYLLSKGADITSNITTQLHHTTSHTLSQPSSSSSSISSLT